MHQAFVQIYNEGGIKGLWRGSVVNVQRAALVSLGGICYLTFLYEKRQNFFTNKIENLNIKIWPHMIL